MKRLTEQRCQNRSIHRIRNESLFFVVFAERHRRTLETDSSAEIINNLRVVWDLIITEQSFIIEAPEKNPFIKLLAKPAKSIFALVHVNKSSC